MPRCVKCQNNGLTLKLDFDGFCQSCHSWRIKDYEKDIAERDAELAELRAFHAEYVVIPDAKLHSKRILFDAQEQADALVAKAKVEHDRIIAEGKSEAEELTKRAELLFNSAENVQEQAEQTSKFILADLDNRISILLQESAKEFHFRARGRVAELYSKSPKSDSVMGTNCNFTALTVAGFKKIAAKYGYITFDFETTGLSAKRDRIIEIGAIRYDNQCQELERFSTLVNPERDIPETASKINGITNDMVVNAPTIDVAMADFLKFLGNGETPMVAHNAPFDISFFEAALNKLSFPFTANYADSIAIAKKTFKLKSYSLESICDHIGYDNTQAHRAIGDADAIDAIIQECIEF